jgi:hypothetical protein
MAPAVPRKKERLFTRAPIGHNAGGPAGWKSSVTPSGKSTPHTWVRILFCVKSMRALAGLDRRGQSASGHLIEAAHDKDYLDTNNIAAGQQVS